MKMANVSWHGEKLGSSSGLFCDKKEGLHYYLVTERASVLWDSHLELKVQTIAYASYSIKFWTPRILILNIDKKF